MTSFNDWMLGVVNGRNLEEDYHTNSPSYYDDLSRRNKLMEMLAKKIWEYDEEMAKRFAEWDENLQTLPDDLRRMLEEWMLDGTLDHIINDTIFSWKADQTEVDEIQLKLNDIEINVRDYGAVGDGVTDDHAAIQAAIDAAPTGATIRLGNHFCGSTLIIPTAKRPLLKGQTFLNASSFNAPVSGIIFAKMPVGILIEGGRLALEDLVLRGTENADPIRNEICIKAGDAAVTTNRVTIQRYKICIHSMNGYYNKFYDTYMGYSDKGLVLNNCYNVISKGLSIDIDVTGIELHNKSTMRLFGCAIEHFTIAGIEVNGGSQVNLFGTYFEGADGYCVLMDTAGSLNNIGSHVYFPGNTKGFASVKSTANTKSIRLFSRNNQFSYPTVDKEMIMYRLAENDKGTSIDIAGDNWHDNVPALIQYIELARFDNQRDREGIYQIILPPHHPQSGFKDVSSVIALKNRNEPMKTISPVNDWGVTGGGFYKDASGNLHIQARLTNGLTVNNTILFTLPEGYRPAGTTHVTATTRIAPNTPHSIPLLVYSNGNVQLGSAAGDYLILNTVIRL